MLNRILWCCMVLFSYTCDASQDSCRISYSGKILDANTGFPIEGASVFFSELQIGDRTDSNGIFQLDNLCPGVFTLICQHLNHEPKTERVNLINSVNQKMIYLSCHIDSLHQVVVKGARLHWEDVAVQHKVQGKDLFLGSGLSLGKSLEKVSGVYNLSTGNNIQKPVIRGMHSNRVLILNNEIRQEGQQWGNEHAPEIDHYVAKQIDVIKGAQTIRYGSDIIGGVILVNPKPMEQITISNGELNLAGFSNGRSMAVSALFEGRTRAPLGITWRLQGTAKRAGNAHTPDYTLKNTGMRELNYSASLGYQRRQLAIEWFHSYFNTDIGIFSGSHIGNLTDLYQAFSAEKPIDSATFSYQIGLPYQHVAHHLQKVKARLALNGIGELKAMYGLQLNTRKEFDKTLAAKQDDGTYAPSLHFLLQTHSFDISLEHEPVRRMVGAIGINGFYQQNNYYGNYFIPNYQKFTGGLYITEKWHWHAFSMEAGMRYDLNTFSIQKWENQVLISPAHQYHGLAATTAFRYQFPFVTLHLNMGTTWRAPFVNELYSYGVHHSAASFEIGDRRLKQERSYNTSVTMDIAIRKKFDAEFTLYHHYINDFINLQPQLPATLTIRGAFPTFRFSQIDAIFQGAEFAGSMQWHKHIRSYVKANLTLARQVQNQQFLVGIPPGRIETDIDIRCFEKRNVTMNWSAGVVYTGRQHRVRSDADYVDAPAAYTLLQTDVYLTIKTHSKQLQLNAGVQNLLNTSYRDYMNRNRYFADELGRNVHLRLSIPFSFGKLS